MSSDTRPITVVSRPEGFSISPGSEPLSHSQAADQRVSLLASADSAEQNLDK
ncbi:MAG TPA: hypothetical protein VKV38_13125 [Trebonia sp.]|nr:hypothetical protein [Trebonia sp.]